MGVKILGLEQAS